ncbi:MAG: M23 family metallopeptidase [Sphingomonadales bacterium]|nr:MAG: M23 family metallopeptidase [Sphingomonadales bacterium]
MLRYENRPLQGREARWANWSSEAPGDRGVGERRILEQLRDLPGESEPLIDEPLLDFGESATEDLRTQKTGPGFAEHIATTGKLVLKRAEGWAARYDEWREAASAKLEAVDFAPDLAEDIGSKRWFRGLGTMLGLGAVALAMWPDFAPLEARPAMVVDPAARDEFRSHMITPLALGADSGRQMGASRYVTPLESAPERPQVELVATLARGDSFDSMLRRAGLASGDAARVLELVQGAIPLTEIQSGTRVDITLGRRLSEGERRPLDSLNFRARFDLELAVENNDGNLSLRRRNIRVDDTPLRIRGTVGQSLYRSARAAGAPASAVQDFIKALDGSIDLNRNVSASDEFDMIVAYRRAATGERQAGQLLYAGIDRGGEPRTQLMRWGSDGIFYDAAGDGEQANGLIAPVPGRTTSGFGMRRHPILGYRRMHSGLDFSARYGTPIVAVTDGRITSAGRAGGCGIAVRIDHGSGVSTRYCHMSRMAVNRGQQVRRGQVIGYVGSTGLSTGAHLHYEMYRGGRAVDPRSVRFVNRAKLEGRELMNFRAALAELKQIEPGAALEDLEQRPEEMDAPKREIEKLDNKREIT